MDIEPNQPPVQPQWGSAPPAPPEKKKFPVWGWILIAVGVCCCGCVPILAAILFPVFAQAKIAATTTMSLSNLKQLGTSLMIYQSDNDDVSMPKENWHAAISPYTKSETLLIDPLLGMEGENLGYGYNGAMSKVEVFRLESPMEQVVFGLTSTPGKDALISKDTIRSIAKSSDKTLIAYADGHVKKVEVAAAKTMGWQPKLMKK